MAFVDEMKFHARAGRGGDGVVRWRHEKGKEFAGAAGGNGGKGGDIYVRAVRDISLLARYRRLKEFVAENGVAGMRNSQHGKDGDDLIIDMPLGSAITDSRTGRTFNLTTEGETVRILKGGRGGVGNEYFKSAVNTSPEESREGTLGEEADFAVELSLFADVGLIGEPNAGKSSLLNALTRAGAKVGSYAFTTLEPNLGAMYEYILADIPGLIEGASEGKGLGHAFLRHVRRTKMLVHCISAEHEDPVAMYKTIRHELTSYGQGLVEKPELIVLTKTDIVTPEQLAARMKALKPFVQPGREVLSVSILDDQSVKSFRDRLSVILQTFADAAKT
jgi:GTP-binding protein